MCACLAVASFSLSDVLCSLFSNESRGGCSQEVIVGMCRHVGALLVRHLPGTAGGEPTSSSAELLNPHPATAH